MYHDEDLKEIYKKSNSKTRKKSIQLPKTKKAVSNKNSYMVALKCIIVYLFTAESVSWQATFQQWNVSCFRHVYSKVNIETYGMSAYSLPRTESSIVRALESVAGGNSGLSRVYQSVALRQREQRRPQRKAQFRGLPTRVFGY